MSLYDRFQDENIKSYYGNLRINPILEPEKSWDFIQQYFKLGGKEKAFDLEFSQELKQSGKHIHTISMYYIGCLLSEMIESELTCTLHELIPGFGQDFNYKFIYSWFLTCLYHDTAYVLEDKHKFVNYIGVPSFYLKEELNKNKVKYDVFEHKWIEKRYKKYSKDLVEKYFYYCLTYRRKIDHGIIGGFILYDRLKKNYEAKWQEYSKSNTIEHKASKAHFKLDGLSWIIEHLDHFAYISDAIIAHNIWYNEDAKLYEKFGLSELIESKANKKSKKDNPLLFFLAIVDTIEPTKFFDKLQPQYVWKNIDISYNRENSSIRIQVLKPTILNYEAWFTKIESLEKWLNVAIEKSPENMKINIRIQP